MAGLLFLLFAFSLMVVLRWMGQGKLFKQDTLWQHSEANEEGLCQQCGYDLRGGHQVCPECGTPIPTAEELEEQRLRHNYVLDPRRLRQEWPANPIKPRRPGETEEVVVIHTTSHPIEAQLLKEQLTARGILCQVKTALEYRLVGYVSPNVEHRLVLVCKGDEPHARQILDYFRLPKAAGVAGAATASEPH